MIKKLTVGMATFDDYDGVWATIQAIRMYHSEVVNLIDFVVVDNNPSSADGRDTKAYVEGFGNYVAFDCDHGTTQPRNEVFKQAKTDYVLCIDSHIMLAPHALKLLISYMDQYPNSKHLYHGPLLFDDLQLAATHMRDEWNHCMWGVWDIDDKHQDMVFEIPMHGLGLFACQRRAWLGFNTQFRGFGGEEGYIHQKYRNAGFKAISLPFLKWIHRFRRTKPIEYNPNLADRVRNYVIGLREVGLDINPVIDHFKQYIEPDQMVDLLVELDIEPEELL